MIHVKQQNGGHSIVRIIAKVLLGFATVFCVKAAWTALVEFEQSPYQIVKLRSVTRVSYIQSVASSSVQKNVR
jgi:hypothetical protein